MTCNEYCSQHLPTIEVSASIKRDRTPTQVEIDVTLTAEANDRNRAYEKFESQIQRFKAVVESLTGKILSFKVGAPSESTEEVEKTFKKVEETTITARGTITVSTTDGLGDVIAALIKADLKFTTRGSRTQPLLISNPNTMKKSLHRLAQRPRLLPGDLDVPWVAFSRSTFRTLWPLRSLKNCVIFGWTATSSNIGIH
jgi:hypothetical protein